jgi:hypothetical protein
MEISSPLITLQSTFMGIGLQSGISQKQKLLLQINTGVRLGICKDFNLT